MVGSREAVSLRMTICDELRWKVNSGKRKVTADSWLVTADSWKSTAKNACSTIAREVLRLPMVARFQTPFVGCLVNRMLVTPRGVSDVWQPQGLKRAILEVWQ